MPGLTVRHGKTVKVDKCPGAQTWTRFAYQTVKVMGKSMYREQQQARLGGLAILAWLMTAGRGTLRRFRSLKMCMEVMMEVRWDRVVGPWAGAALLRGRSPPLPPFGRGFDVRSRRALQRWASQRRGGRSGGGSGGRWQRRAAAGVVAGVAAAGVAAAGVAAVGVAAAGVAAAGVAFCVVAKLLGLKVWEAPAREVWARMEGKSQRMLTHAGSSSVA